MKTSPKIKILVQNEMLKSGAFVDEKAWNCKLHTVLDIIPITLLTSTRRS